MAIDPICGMTVDESKAIHAERDGQIFYFCCESCRRKFLAGGKPEPMAPTVHSIGMPAKPVADRSGKYICPMCPGVEQDGPGACPKCGMALEPAQLSVAVHKVIYTCPMHPEIERDAPGSCPICGMA